MSWQVGELADSPRINESKCDVLTEDGQGWLSGLPRQLSSLQHCVMGRTGTEICQLAGRQSARHAWGKKHDRFHLQVFYSPGMYNVHKSTGYSE